MKKGDEGRRHISGNAARAAADDRAAADSEQAEQREKDPVATAARATPGWPRLERIVPLECSPRWANRSVGLDQLAAARVFEQEPARPPSTDSA
jgi:hypothetical protein